jgi:hypothetical protein
MTFDAAAVVFTCAVRLVWITASFPIPRRRAVVAYGGAEEW